MGRLDRNRLNEFREDLDLADGQDPAPTARMLAQVYDGGSIPTTVPKVFLMHPAFADAADTEGAIPSFSADTTRTIPAVALGTKIPAAGDVVVLHAIGGRWVCGDSGAAPVDCYPCAECAIPIKNLAFRVGTGGTVYTMYLVDTRHIDGNIRWDTGCLSSPSTASGGTVTNCTATQDIFEANLTCATENPTLGIAISDSAHYPCNPTTSGVPPKTLLFGCFLCDSPSGKGLDLIDFTCNPFFFHFRSNGLVSTGLSVDCPRVTTAMGGTDFYVYDPDAVTAVCGTNATVNVVGCNGLPLSGATVTVKTATGTTVASGTTDGAGNFSFSGGQANATVVISASRFLTQTWTAQNLLVLTSTSFDLSVQSDGFTPNTATGYQCFNSASGGCAYPLPGTLHCTWSIAGAQTFTFGTDWVSSFSFGGHNYVVTLGFTGIMIVTRDGASGGPINFTLTSCPMAFAGTITPTGTVLAEIGTGALTE